MRIGFDAKRVFNNFTGLGNYSRSLIANLHAANPEIELHLFSPKIQRTAQTEPFLVGDDFQVHTPKKGLKSLWRSYGITGEIDQNAIEIYHGLSNELPLNIRQSKAKSVVTIHDLIFLKYPQTYKPIDRAMYQFKFKKAIENADKVIAISASTKQDIIDWTGVSPEKVEVIYQSCDPIFYQPQSVDQIKVNLQGLNLPSEFFLSVGTVERRKNLEVVLKAYHQLPAAQRIPLVVVGGGKAYKEQMKQLAAELKLEFHIIWMESKLTTAQLQALYQSAAGLIYPSLYEGFGLPVVEAMLSRTPVITSNVSSLPEAAGEHSLLIDPKSSEELSDAIQQLTTDSTLRQEISDQGLAYAHAQFNPELQTHALLDLYHSLL